MSQGSFIISLDFELHWGVRDVVSVAATRDHFLRARKALPEMLRRFEASEVHATWATVGFLFARNKKELFEHMPDERPKYANPSFDPYGDLDTIGEDEGRDPFHFAPSLLERIAETRGQEIATHTFSHYYCLEEGQTERAFDADLRAAARIASRFGPVTPSIVFPRGQHNPDYAAVLKNRGVRTYRTPPSLFAYAARRAGNDHLGRRVVRLLDSYVPLAPPSGTQSGLDGDGLVALEADVFLRPYTPTRRVLEARRRQRIARAMRRAAERGRDFHLWWHPHNFGTHTGENLEVLDFVLSTYRDLRERYSWPSRTMTEAGDLVRTTS